MGDFRPESSCITPEGRLLLEILGPQISQPEGLPEEVAEQLGHAQIVVLRAEGEERARGWLTRGQTLQANRGHQPVLSEEEKVETEETPGHPILLRTQDLCLHLDKTAPEEGVELPWLLH
jgi:hypothetical protein